MIYYARRGDGLVKIGTTRAGLKSRLRHLSYEHGPLELLTVASGSFAQERALHTRFADLRVSGEWFRNGRSLSAHIRHLRSRAAS